MFLSVKYLDGKFEQAESLIRPGKVAAKYVNGDTFEGIFVKDKNGNYVKDGYGVYVWVSGAEYQGNYKENVRDGHGIYIFPGGAKFEGEWKAGKKHGKGKYTYPNGDVFYGNWDMDERQGKGKYVYARTGSIMNAEWQGGKLQNKTWRITVSKTNPRKRSHPPLERKKKRRGVFSLVLAGGPASGKGTQCQLISEEYGLIHLSTGDMFRDAIAAGMEIGMKAQEYMDKGQLIPDDIVIEALKQRLNEPDVKAHGCILDGFPRTAAQARALKELGLNVDKFILLNVPDHVIIERVAGRRLDPETGKIYHTTFNPPPEDVIPRLLQRPDDTEETARKRINDYHKNITEIKDHYLHCLIEVDGAPPKDEVWKAVDEAILSVHSAPGIIIAGPPAAGKGTQCEKIKKAFGVVHLSTGDMLRAAITSQSPVGLKASTYMKRGELVPDDIMIAIIHERLQERDVKRRGFLLDGFPRTRVQAEALQKMGINIDVVIVLQVPDEELIKRVVGRRLDPETGYIYHLEFDPPPKEILGRLVHREDDTEKTAKTRLETYHKNIEAIRMFYNEQIREINGNLSKDDVWQQIDKVLDIEIY